MEAFQMSPDLFGWHENPAAVEAVMKTMPMPLFGAAAGAIQGSGKGQVALLYEAVRKVYGRDIILTQKRGVCVSKGWSKAIDTVKAVQIVAGAREQFTGTTASEVIYGGARIQIGRGGCGNQDGAVGAWAAQFVSTFGTLIRGTYGRYDLTRENDAIAVDFGAPGHGVPEELLGLCAPHKVLTTSLVTAYEEARDSIYNGYTVAVCSNRGFQMVRDADGFSRPSGSWPHCMCFTAVDDGFRRPGLLCDNSWGPNWITGPKRHDQPDGTFWVDADTVNEMLRGQDSWAVSGYVGYPMQRLSHLFV